MPFLEYSLYFYRMAPSRTRILPVLALMLGAPVCAEYLQAYLPTTGELWVQLAGLLILGPLYGGAALLIRELAVRTGRGWTGILLMAAAFGLLMTGTVDLSLWLEDDPSVPYWSDLRTSTLVEPWGLAVYPLLSWVSGHVLYSIGAPLAMLDALAPGHRGRPLLGQAGIAVTATLALTAAILIHRDQQQAFDLHPSALQLGAVAATALALVALALSPLGRPVAGRRDGGIPSLPALAGISLLAGLSLELLPMTWPGTVGYAGIGAVAVVMVARLAGRSGWGLPQIAAMTTAALVARTLIGFLAPLPPGVPLAAKVSQSAALLLLTVALSALAWRRARPRIQPSQPHPVDGPPRSPARSPSSEGS